MVSTYGRAGPPAPGVLDGLLRRDRVDEEPGSPLEARHAGELGDDLQVPVEVVEGPGAERCAVEHVVEWRIAGDPPHAPQDLAKKPRQRGELPRVRLLVGGTMAAGEDPGLEGKARGGGGQGHEAVALA